MNRVHIRGHDSRTHQTKDGSLIAIIITTHMPRNDAAAPDHGCPGIRIHAIDVVQPPGIGRSPIADMGVPGVAEPKM